MKSFPKSYPFESFRNLVSWEKDPFHVCRIPKRERQNSRKAKIIVCHDMAGGYKQDASVQGDSDPLIYYTKYWSLFDTFIYFSHSCITIPPVTWVNAAHKNGVSILGTIITENQNGMEENLYMIYGPSPNNRVQFSPFYADLLVEIALYNGFDGWFINIESPLDPKHIQNLIQFLAYFRSKMHQAKHNSYIIWYDSLTIHGKIHWQNKLTVLNKPFFDVTDGIFTNYFWGKNGPYHSTLLAGNRCNDVYSGIDIWGRNTYGGGGFNTHVALREIVNSGTSVALFATEWTFEFFDSINFDKIEKRFWIDKSICIESHSFDSNFGGLNPECVRDWVSPSAVVINRGGMYTNFDCGLGQSYYISGKRVSDKAWSHLSRQSCIMVISMDSSSKKMKAEYSRLDSFHGGSCLEIYTMSKSLDNWESLMFTISNMGQSTPLRVKLVIKPFISHLSIKSFFECQKQGRIDQFWSKELKLNEWNELFFHFDSMDAVCGFGLSVNLGDYSLESDLHRNRMFLVGELRITEHDNDSLISMKQVKKQRWRRERLKKFRRFI